MQIQIRSADEPSTTFYKYVFFESLSLSFEGSWEGEDRAKTDDSEFL